MSPSARQRCRVDPADPADPSGAAAGTSARSVRTTSPAPCAPLTTPYDGYAAEYTTLLQTHRAEHLAETIELVRALLAPVPPGNGRLVDLACGPGLVSAALAGDGWRVTGVDASGELVRIARTRLDRVLHADATATGLPDGAEVVVSTYSHTDVGSWPALIAEAHRLLHPAGTLVYVGAHPAFVGPHMQRRDHSRWPARVAAGYYHSPALRHRAPGLSPGGVRQRVGVRHLTMPALLAPLLDPGWRMLEIREDAADPPTLIGLRVTRT